MRGKFAAIANLHGGAIKIHRAVGAGYAPPATIYYNQYNGLACRGGH